MRFYDRREAGRLLAQKLQVYQGKKNTLVIGLARGGIIVACEVAQQLLLPFNFVVPRKIGAPGNPELALGSIMEDGEGVFNSSIIRVLGVSQSYIDNEINKEKILAQNRLKLYRQFLPAPFIEGQTVLLVDDGIATGSTMLASIHAMRKSGAARVVVAVPVSSVEAFQQMEEVADEVICLYAPEDFLGVGMFYSRFDQTTDKEIMALLKMGLLKNES